MEECSSYIKNWYPDALGYCLDTKEMEFCSCHGDESKCNYYPEKKRARK